eukprot:2099788-Rhodomonas_salina.4
MKLSFACAHAPSRRQRPRDATRCVSTPRNTRADKHHQQQHLMLIPIICSGTHTHASAALTYLVGNGLGHQRLAAPGRAVQEHST